jgi:hypothetical protein
MKKVLRDDINSQYTKQDIQLLLNKASFLDPRFKSLKYLSLEEQQAVHDEVLIEIVAFMTENSDMSDSDVTSS